MPSGSSSNFNLSTGRLDRERKTEKKNSFDDRKRIVRSATKHVFEFRENAMRVAPFPSIRQSPRATLAWPTFSNTTRSYAFTFGTVSVNIAQTIACIRAMCDNYFLTRVSRYSSYLLAARSTCASEYTGCDLTVVRP